MDELRNNRPMNDPYYPILKSQEEKKLEEWKKCKDDEELARKLQQLEIIESKNNKSKEENLSVSKRDELYALKLLKEEKLKEERKKNEGIRYTEEDELLARRLQEEEKRKKQLEDDEILAKKMMDEEKRLEEKRIRENQYVRSQYIPPPPISYPSFYPSTYSPYNPYGTQNIPNDKRTHAVNIHNRYCSCGKTSTWNNNHIIEYHTKYCGCDLMYRPYNYNQGRKHEHDYRCCTMNHLHMKTCKCYYRDHVHDETCCQTYHSHTIYCHCSHK